MKYVIRAGFVAWLLVLLAAVLNADWPAVAGMCGVLLVGTFAPEIVARWWSGIYDIDHPEDRVWPFRDRRRP